MPDFSAWVQSIMRACPLDEAQYQNLNEIAVTSEAKKAENRKTYLDLLSENTVIQQGIVEMCFSSHLEDMGAASEVSIEPIKMGGFAKIFKVTYAGKSVIVKMVSFRHSEYLVDLGGGDTIPKPSASNEELVRDRTEVVNNYLPSFLREARIISEQLIGVPEIVGDVILFKLYLDGNAVSLFDYVLCIPMKVYEPLKIKEVWSEKEALSLVSEILGYLQRIHEQHRYIHRDISPDNIMKTADNRYILLDWGSARAMDELVTHTRNGTMGEWLRITYKEGYSDPERGIRGGDNPVDLQGAEIYENFPGIDVYSVGVVLFRLLYGSSLGNEVVFCSSKGPFSRFLKDDPDLYLDRKSITNLNCSEDCKEIIRKATNRGDDINQDGKNVFNDAATMKEAVDKLLDKLEEQTEAEQKKAWHSEEYSEVIVKAKKTVVGTKYMTVFAILAAAISLFVARKGIYSLPYHSFMDVVACFVMVIVTAFSMKKFNESKGIPISKFWAVAGVWIAGILVTYLITCFGFQGLSAWIPALHFTGLPLAMVFAKRNMYAVIGAVTGFCIALAYVTIPALHVVKLSLVFHVQHLLLMVVSAALGLVFGLLLEWLTKLYRIAIKEID